MTIMISSRMQKMLKEIFNYIFFFTVLFLFFMGLDFFIEFTTFDYGVTGPIRLADYPSQVANLIGGIVFLGFSGSYFIIKLEKYIGFEKVEQENDN